LANEAQVWLERGTDDRRSKGLNLSDGRRVTYDELAAEYGEPYAERTRVPYLEQQARITIAAMDRLAAVLKEARPDVVVIIGDDQGELFNLNNMPAVSVYYGETLVMHPFPLPAGGGPEWLQNAVKGYGMDSPHEYPAAPEFALALIGRLMDAGFDIAAASQVKDPATAGFGHAFGFVIERLFAGRPIPVVPVLLNTYYPPNVPRPARCYDFGRALRAAIESSPGAQRVAVIASGGLSHFVTDEVLDGKVLGALRTGDAESLRALPMAALQDGSSEILCWVTAAGALEHLKCGWTEYVPVRRTPAGSGIGLGFAIWQE
jgi:hypothetical protein